ncbi:hypothetical protein JVT61DRAFT_9910 [Boletus reticuloceps]|uniref:Uncharacterized protein n=1 Tax=Boletus reticuloceps TaxID=495285 RepID=A0A8I2YG37_9AGAM|nr:hypothetical protein JVT61DRAFT_9910 [Boletus reticuloceps]
MISNDEPHDVNVNSASLQSTQTPSSSVPNDAPPEFAQVGPSLDANIDPVLLSQGVPLSSRCDNHLSSPLTSHPFSLCQSTGSHSLHPFNLISAVHGVQVPESAQTVEWPGGLMTVLPTLVHEDKNYLHYDMSYVHIVAAYPQATPDS